jgi:hypothetical protein
MNTAELNLILMGAIATLDFVAGVIFLRYWRSSGDRFFLFFMASFGIEGMNRLHMGLSAAGNESLPLNYSIRLLSYALIVYAIWDKNRSRSR